jgi:hypothetical protein
MSMYIGEIYYQICIYVHCANIDVCEYVHVLYVCTRICIYFAKHLLGIRTFTCTLACIHTSRTYAHTYMHIRAYVYIHAFGHNISEP